MGRVSLRIGLVGAGPWAMMATAPMLAAGPATSLAGVWARRPEAAADLGSRLGVPVASSFEALLSACDAVAFAVPPDVQAELAPVAAAAGRHLMLEKPLAFAVEAAERVAAAADTAGVVTQLMLTNRWTDAVRTFLGDVRGAVPRVLTAEFVGSQACTGSPFATPWRRPETALLDVGPHVLDLVEAAAGPATVVHARRTGAATAVTLQHDSGAVSRACARASVWPVPSRRRSRRATDGSSHYVGAVYAAVPGYRALELDLWVPDAPSPRRWWSGCTAAPGCRATAGSCPRPSGPGRSSTSCWPPGWPWPRSSTATHGRPPSRRSCTTRRQRSAGCGTMRTELGLDPARVGIGGESAGGHLAALVGLTADRPDLEGEVGVAGPSSAVDVVLDWYGVACAETMPEFDLPPDVAARLSPGGPVPPLEVLLDGADDAARER